MRTILMCFAVILTFTHFRSVRGTVGVTVNCGQGKVEGVEQQTISGRDVVAFLGIPFAKPPIGDLRFKDPVPPEPWTGTLVASKAPNICLQLDYSSATNISGSEDCLYLNIFIPKNGSTRNVDDLMDVMVYVHGGGFQLGSANSHSPSYLLDQESVVLVILNYRLGILGFLSLLDEHLPGNWGLKDQTMALKWVENNIAHFGGDPNKVTLVGCSAGGASVHAHVLSSLSRGLFQKAIITSGVAFNPWMFERYPIGKALNISKALGCPTDDYQLLVQCLRQRPAKQIAALTQLYTGSLELDVVQFSPVIEPPSSTAFIDSTPDELIRSGRAMDIPMMFAYMEDDAIFATAEILSNPALVEKFENNWAEHLSHMKYFDLEGTAKRYVAESIRKFYLGSDRILDNPSKFTQMYTDWAFKVGIEKAAKFQASYATSPIYAYVFSYVSSNRYSDYYNASHIYKGGACHGDDLYYVLETSYLKKRTGDPEDDAMSRTTIDLWMKFIKGDVPEKWKPVNFGLPHFTYLNVTSPDSEGFELRTATDNYVAEFWDSLEKFRAGQIERDEL